MCLSVRERVSTCRWRLPPVCVSLSYRRWRHLGAIAAPLGDGETGALRICPTPTRLPPSAGRPCAEARAEGRATGGQVVRLTRHYDCSALVEAPPPPPPPPPPPCREGTTAMRRRRQLAACTPTGRSPMGRHGVERRLPESNQITRKHHLRLLPPGHHHHGHHPRARRSPVLRSSTHCDVRVRRPRRATAKPSATRPSWAPQCRTRAPV